MKRILGTSVALIALASQGLAYAGWADWQGFYVGANAGAGFNDSSYKLQPTGCFLTGTCGGGTALNPLRTDTGNFTDTDFIGGLQVGYNYLFYDNKMLLGLEADIDYNGIDDTDTVNRPLVAPLSGRFQHKVKQEFDWFGTVRLRFGGPISCRWIAYVTGGYAYGHIKSTTTALFTLAGDAYNGSSTSNRGGIALGAGTEYAFADNWSARLEYLFMDLGNYSYRDNGNAIAAPVGATYKTTISTRDNILRFGLNYKFSGF